MSPALARMLVDAIAVYFAIGAIVAVPIMIFELGRIDPATKEAPWTFRVLVLPGVVAMWPVLVRLLVKSRSAR
jgi:hypothetical protein